jgi:hypothetical protein
MRAHLYRTFLILALACGVPRARAFALLGALDTWMTEEIGYNLADPGGPMNLGEEYRWNMPIVTYGFDESFLNYFGQRGVEEVEKAIKLLNDLPPVSQMSPDLSEFPLDTRRINYRANALFVFDLKTQALASLLESLGVAPAERYVWTLRGRTVINNVPVYAVIKRNFDPVTWNPSSYVNGVLYTYQILQTYANPDVWEAVEFEVDPSLPSVTSVSAFNIWGGTVLANGIFATLSPGLFFTGLTRDDVGALRYIYRPDNYNVEVLMTNAVQAPLGTQRGNYVIGVDSGGKVNGWGAPPGFTNVLGGTNLPPVNVAIRPGVDKVSFVRVNWDSMVGAWVTLTNVFEDRYISNSVQRTQLIQRTLPAPDIIFDAADLGIAPDGTPIFYAKAMSLTSQDAINGTTTLSGPGQIFPPHTITFSKLGEYLINSPEGGQGDGFPGAIWGAYDGTATEPYIFPQGASIRDLERLILEGKIRDRTANPWLSPFIVVGATGQGGQGGTGGTGGFGGGGGGGGGTTP